MSELGRILVGWMTGPGFVRPVRALMRTGADGRRTWKSVTAQRWQPVTVTVVFTPDPVQPQGA
jgi:hypothetical protein